MRIIVIGGVAAGTKAASKAKRFAPENEVWLFQEGEEVAYSACGMPYVISGDIKHRDAIIIRQPHEFAKEGIEVFTSHKVTGIDTATQEIDVIDLNSEKIKKVAYDRLILATGARPIIPAMQNIHLEGVLALRTLADLDQFKTTIFRRLPKHAVIIGAGYIGLELAESLDKLGITTTIVEKAERILPRFDPEIAQAVFEHLIENNIAIILKDGLAKVLGESNRVSAIETESGRLIETDLVVLAIGIKPNVELAQAGGIALGTGGAIAVDARMATNIPSIFAAGDCCETTDRITGSKTWQPLGDIANLQGRVAGENAAGGNALFPGIIGTAIFKTFRMNVACTGLSEQHARSAGFNPISVTVKMPDRARYYPDGQNITLKLIADKTDGVIVGAQAIGSGKTDKIIDIIATALLGKLNCRDLEYADLAYSPPFSTVLSPVIVAAGALAKKVDSFLN